MFRTLTPEAIDTLKWIDQFGTGRAVPSGLATPIEQLLNDGLIYLSGSAGRVELTDDGKAFLADAYD